jgi:GDPmannose 4,6-dehydratase
VVFSAASFGGKRIAERSTLASKRALIIGATGQDGAYLSKHLLTEGYEVIGTSRDHRATSTERLARVGALEGVTLLTMVPADIGSVMATLSSILPDEIYNLSGQSAVSLSFEQPTEAFVSIANTTLNVLEAIRRICPECRLFNAGSSECFGNTPDPANENTPFAPLSPYGVAKVASLHLVAAYRRAYNLFASSAITFNHESPLRPSRFFTKKVVSAAARISKGSAERLEVGHLDAVRDWGWAPEYVVAMHSQLQLDEPCDLVIGTGVGTSLRRIVERAFEVVGLDHREHVDADRESRPADISVSIADPSRARSALSWNPETRGEALIDRLVQAELSGAIY